MIPAHFSLTAQLAAGEREIKQRHNAYSGLISRGKMQKKEATYQLCAIQAIANTARKLNCSQGA